MTAATTTLGIPEASPPPATTALSWSLARRILFRFFFCYWTFWALPEDGRVSIFTSIPGLDKVVAPYGVLWHAIVPWVGLHVFHLDAQTLIYRPTGSGDTVKDWIEVFCYLAFSLVITLMWSILDRKRKEYDTLQRWLRVIVRYNLGLTLLAYGAAKVIPLQFQEPRFYYLMKSYGQASPMGALWRFMGSSLPYTIFAGLAEYGSGVLLFFRRTTILGALAAAGVMLNVVVLNYCYDVPVKLYSTHLLMMALFLLAPDAKRLFNVVVLNRAAASVDSARDVIRIHRFSDWRYARRGMVAFKLSLVAVVLGTSFYEMWNGYRQTYANRQRPPLYGLYEVESFVRSNSELPPLITDKYRWRRAAFENPGSMQGWQMDDTTFFYQIQVDEAKRLITLKLPNAGTGRLEFTGPSKGIIELEGMLAGEPVKMRLRALDRSQFLLLNRGFHWVQELPFNR